MRFSILVLTLALFLSTVNANVQITHNKEQCKEPSTEQETKKDKKDKVDKEIKKEESSFGKAIFPFFFYPVLTDNIK